MNIHPFPNAVNYFLRYYFIPLKKYTTLLIFYSALPQLRLQNFNRARNCTKFVTYSIRSVVYFYLYVYEKPSDFITRHPHRHHRPHPHRAKPLLKFSSQGLHTSHAPAYGRYRGVPMPSSRESISSSLASPLIIFIKIFPICRVSSFSFRQSCQA